MFEPRDAGKREVVFRSQLLSQPTISGWRSAAPDGSFFAGHKRGGDGVLETLRSPLDHQARGPIATNIAGHDLISSLEQPCRGHQLFGDRSRNGFAALMRVHQTNNWATLTSHPQRRAAGRRVRGPHRHRQRNPPACIAIIIELDARVSNFLSQLTVGKIGASAPSSSSATARWSLPDPNANEAVALKPIIRCFRSLSKRSRTPARTIPVKASRFIRIVTRDGKAYQAVITPISFPGSNT